MTEGNLASWKVKEGDSFAAGDVLLEIETDKASMDVEAQDDGIMAKIMAQDGSKGIKVGTRIGVIAESGDDLNTLEIPPEEKTSKPAPKEDTTKPEPEAMSTSQAEFSQKPSKGSSPNLPVKESSGIAKKQTYPLLPSVEHLIHEHGLDASAVEKMTPSGPNNRLLKGDVLAYLGSISTSYPAELSTRIEKLSHLDLSNIKLAIPVSKTPKTAAAVPDPASEDLEVAIAISMQAVTEVQKRIQNTLGVFMPLSTFIARATDVANDNLPRPKLYKPTADELFNQVLGLDKITSSSGVRGSFLPQITALPSIAPTRKPTTLGNRSDIIDILSGTSRSSGLSLGRQSPGMSASANVFSLKVPKGDKKRAQVFLDRVKTVLENEPGRLIL